MLKPALIGSRENVVTGGQSGMMDQFSIELSPKFESSSMNVGFIGVAERLLMAVICILLGAVSLVILAMAAFGRLVRKCVWL